MLWHSGRILGCHHRAPGYCGLTQLALAVLDCPASRSPDIHLALMIDFTDTLLVTKILRQPRWSHSAISDLFVQQFTPQPDGKPVTGVVHQLLTCSTRTPVDEAVQIFACDNDGVATDSIRLIQVVKLACLLLYPCYQVFKVDMRELFDDSWVTA